MSQRIARLVILATVIALAACTSPTSPTSADCGGGSTVGSGNHC
ncbi:MAG TPA: hypothetical protein VK679_02175 [Gemmatimonadaceae bacterium]|jgi:hypothetical protein|nr:hypothetical protein [Gemmatimonadaceae bacterium]